MEGVAYPDLILVWLEAIKGVFFLKFNRSLNEEEGREDEVAFLKGEEEEEEEEWEWEGREGGPIEMRVDLREEGEEGGKKEDILGGKGEGRRGSERWRRKRKTRREMGSEERSTSRR